MFYSKTLRLVTSSQHGTLPSCRVCLKSLFRLVSGNKNLSITLVLVLVLVLVVLVFVVVVVVVVFVVVVVVVVVVVLIYFIIDMS